QRKHQVEKQTPINHEPIKSNHDHIEKQHSNDDECEPIPVIVLGHKASLKTYQRKHSEFERRVPINQLCEPIKSNHDHIEKQHSSDDECEPIPVIVLGHKASLKTYQRKNSEIEWRVPACNDDSSAPVISQELNLNTDRSSC